MSKKLSVCSWYRAQHCKEYCIIQFNFTGAPACVNYYDHSCKTQVHLKYAC